ncbi:hypothetical protein [Halapricum salinum]|uniref:Uncharacterized protein n=1 Tax=Halapricum salinum TaxID=1457250 RepID=A0A4D6HIU5_9EURY|nr:hypothetical protein [Halapricum salinum]QCC52627.1 hypothetical protein DV733_15935 [Halapricum salinum]
MGIGRRSYLARLGVLVGGAVGSASAGCVGIDSERPPSVTTVVEDWRRTFSPSRYEGHDGIGRLAATDDGSLAVAGLTRTRDDEGHVRHVPWIRGFDSEGRSQWEYYVPSTTAGSNADETGETAPSQLPFGLSTYDGDFVVGIATVGPEGRVTDPTLVRLGPDGSERWTNTFAAANVGQFAIASREGGGSRIIVPSTEPRGDDRVSLNTVGLADPSTRRVVLDTELLGSVHLLQSAGPERLALLGAAAGERESLVRADVRPEGRVVRELTIGSDLETANPKPVLSEDGSVVAINSTTPTFTAWADVVTLTDGSIVHHLDFRGWEVVDITQSDPFAPPGGFLLTMRNAGENEGEPPGALFVAVDGDGEVRWHYDGLGQDTAIGPGIGDAVVVGEHLFVGGTAPEGDDSDRRGRLVRYSPGPGQTTTESD